MLLSQDKEKKLIKGSKVENSLYLSHLLFLDDVIIFGDGSVYEWKRFYDIINLLCDASSMSIRTQKSSFIYSCDSVAAATVLPKFLKSWAPPHDFALF